MASLKKELVLGISGLALLSSMSLYSQDCQINQKFQENKNLNYCNI